MFLRRARTTGAHQVLGTIARPVLGKAMMTRDVLAFLNDDEPVPLNLSPRVNPALERLAG